MAETPLITLQKARLGFGGHPLFDNLDFSLLPTMKAALVGQNGTGKSTLMKVLAGQVLLDSGDFFCQPGSKIGYLEQDPDLSAFDTILDYVCSGLSEDVKEDIWRAETVLEEVGLEGHLSTQNLSGGEQKRVAIARTLVMNPDLLLLDEPTNHLDLPTIMWLEKKLKAFKGALLIISHDRAFLNNITNSILWLDRGEVRTNPINFSGFEEWRDKVLEEEEVNRHKLNRKIASETKWMREGLSARRKRNMGRVRKLMELRQTRKDWLKGGQKVTLNIAESERSGKMVIEAENISKQFGDKKIVSDFSTRITKGNRIGIVGANGVGKTTLLKILTGDIPPDSGSIKLGSNLNMIWFDQHRETLEAGATIKSTLCPDGGDSVIIGDQSRHVAAYLKDFLFDPSKFETPIERLSGGERNRLLLAKLFAQPSNFMVLDEPTNDLDMDTLDLLEDVLGEYSGTLLLISHDRDFIDRLVSSTIVVEGDGIVQEYAGGYSDYVIQKSFAETEIVEKTKATKSEKAKVTPTKEKKSQKLSYKETLELENLPVEIEKLEKEIQFYETKLADPDLFSKDPKKYDQMVKLLDLSQQEKDEKEMRWLELEEKQEALSA